MTKAAGRGPNGTGFHLRTVVKVVLGPRDANFLAFLDSRTVTIMQAAAVVEQ